MSFGFLLLCRYYNRLDAKVLALGFVSAASSNHLIPFIDLRQSVKLLDTRYYHEFGSTFIWRDHEVRAASMVELRKVRSE